jgi:uncharacterized protein (DUF2147 family)
MNAAWCISARAAVSTIFKGKRCPRTPNGQACVVGLLGAVSCNFRRAKTVPHRANFRRFATWQFAAAFTVRVIALWLFALGAASAGPMTDSATDPTGEWLVAKRVARIKIVNCDNRFWGVISWEMTPGVDSNNPDRAKRTRPTLGMPILLGMAPAKPNEWKGEIYNGEDGRNYSSSISLLNPDLLKVQGCVLGFLCGGENWTRVSPPAAANPPPSPKSASAKSAAKTGYPPPSSDDAICLGIAGAAGPTH